MGFEKIGGQTRDQHDDDARNEKNEKYRNTKNQEYRGQNEVYESG